jgi:aminopeptidase-like protein
MIFDVNTPGIGERLFDLAAEIFPICRSITGDGVRETLNVLRRHIPLEVREIPTGTQVFDWVVPQEWAIRDAYIKDPSGRKVVDFRASNLHVVSYSRPFRGVLPLAELKTHVHTLPDQPNLVPYRTSYYADQWGFCMADADFRLLPEGDYEVVVDSTLKDGHLTYGECVHRGESADEILLSAHVCHPSLADDNCSGLALLTLLAAALEAMPTRYTYRFLFAPGTIGAITWLALNEAKAQNIKSGLVVSCVGDGGGPTYKKSRRGDALIDRAMAHVLRHLAPSGSVVDFSPYGYDERQYCSPGFNLPVGLFQRSQFGKFPEYHTSADNLDFIKPQHLAQSFRMVLAAIEIVEHDRKYMNLFPKCEPQLGRRGLYTAFGGDKDAPAKSMAMLWVLNLSDGDHSLLDIATRSGLAFTAIRQAADTLKMHGLIGPTPGEPADNGSLIS